MRREELNLEKLLGGKSFIAPCAISYNGHCVSVSTLIGTGANGQLFIDTSKSIDLAKALGRKLYKLLSSLTELKPSMGSLIPASLT